MDDTGIRPKILVVDDSQENILAVELLLRKLDVDIVTAASGQAALSVTLHHDFSLMLLDVMMPDMDGYELAEILHSEKRTADIPIIFITAMDQNEAMEIKGYTKGAVDYIFKPINEIVFLSKIKIHLDLHQKKRHIEAVLFRQQRENPKILIVDDHPENLYILEKILKKVDADVIKASSGNQALSATLYHDFALIILDVQMPEMDGYEVAEILKYDEKTEKIPIIFVTAIDRDSAKEIKGYKTGAVDFIFKPLNEFILVSKVRIFLEIYKMKSGLELLVRERTLELEKANADLAGNNARLKKIVHTTRQLASCAQTGSLGPRILGEFAEHMAATGGSFYLVEDKGLRLLHSLDPNHAPGFISFPLAEKSVFKKALEQGKPLLMEDLAASDTVETSGWKGYRNNSILIFPIMGNSGKVVGVLGLHDKIEGPFTEQDREIGSILTSYSCEIMKEVQAFEALQKSEKDFRTLFEKSNDAIFIVGRQTGQYLDANRAGLELTGRSLEELKKLTTKDVAPDGADKRLSEAQACDEAIDMGEVTFIQPDNTRRVVNLHVVPISESALIGIAKDITRDLEVEKQLRQAQKMESIGTLAGGIAHDFNNILFPIIGHTEMLLSDLPGDSTIKSSLDKIYAGAIRARDLVKQILAFAHQENQVFIQMKIQPIIKEALKLSRSSIPATITIEQDIDKACQMIKADPTQIHQIIMNLTTNAYHAMDTAGGTLTVRLKQVRLENSALIGVLAVPQDYACLTIADTGTGIDTHMMDKIFDPFFTTKEKGRGTGMGLSVVHGIVKSIGGTVKVDSMPGKGSEFHVFLPIYKSRTKAKTSPAPEFIQTGNESLLLVDDDESILTMETRMLERLGYKITSTTDSREALDLFRASPEKFDMIITDMTMPGMAGDRLSAELIKINPHIPILMCTGFSERISEEKATAIGIKGLLMKPVVMKDFAEKIREVLDGS